MWRGRRERSNQPSGFPEVVTGGPQKAVTKSHLSSLHRAPAALNGNHSSNQEKGEGVPTFLHSLLSKLCHQNACSVTPCGTCGWVPGCARHQVRVETVWRGRGLRCPVCRVPVPDSTRDTETPRSEACAFKELKQTQTKAFDVLSIVLLGVEGGRVSQLRSVTCGVVTGSGVPSHNSHAMLYTGFLRVAFLGRSDRSFIKLVT